MTIAFPRPLPSARIVSCAFEIDPQESHAPEHGGRFVSTELGWPLWSLRLTTTPPSEAEFDAWRAWFSSLRGSGQLFFGRDVRRGPYPRAYRTGFAGMDRATGGAFDGTSDTWDTNDARDAIEIEKLPAGFVLGVGDYIGLRWGSHFRSLHRVLAPSPASSGGTGEWVVEPTVHPDVPENATINLVKPDCLMVVTRRDALDADTGGRRVAFDGRQHLVFA